MGEVLRTLDRLELADKTLVIVTSDNGGDMAIKGRTLGGSEFGHKTNGRFRGQKGDAYEGGHRVPFIARWLGKIPAGSVSDEVICLTDFMPSCAAIVGVELPNSAAEDGYNILPVLLGQQHQRPIREATVHHSLHGKFAIRQGKWKLIEDLGSGGLTIPISEKPLPGGPGGQLYDLNHDPSESRNLWLEYPNVVRRLTELLEKYKSQGYSRPL